MRLDLAEILHIDTPLERIAWAFFLECGWTEMRRLAFWSRLGNGLALRWHVAIEGAPAANEVAELRGRNLLEVVRSVNRVIAESEKNVASDKKSSKCVRCASEREWEEIVI